MCLPGALRDAGERAALAGHLVQELVGRPFGVGDQVELGFVLRLADVEHFPFAGGQRARLAAIERDGVELGVARLFADEVDFAIVLQPAERVGGALRTADPRVVMNVDQHAGLAGSRIEGENPAVFVVGGARGDHGFGAVLAPDGSAHLDIAILRAAGLLLSVIHPFHLAGLDVDDGEARSALAVADIGAARDVFGVGAVGDVVGNDGVLGGRGGSFEDGGDHVLLVGRELQCAGGLAGLQGERLARGASGCAYSAALRAVRRARGPLAAVPSVPS